MAFELYYKPHQCFVNVYDIKYDKETGYPSFLIFFNDQWCIVSAKHFRPITSDDLYNRVFKHEQ